MNSRLSFLMLACFLIANACRSEAPTTLDQYVDESVIDPPQVQLTQSKASLRDVADSPTIDKNPLSPDPDEFIANRSDRNTIRRRDGVNSRVLTTDSVQNHRNSDAKTDRTESPVVIPTEENTPRSGEENLQNKEMAAKMLEDENPAKEAIISPQTDQVSKIDAAISSSSPNIHDPWNLLLNKYVSETGCVNYTGFKNDLSKIEAYLVSLSSYEVQKGETSNKAKAFWINLYNAATVKLILDHFPLSSIMEIDNGKPWDRKWISLDGSIYSLNEIEHEIIRPTFNDARIHFAVNCAAKSCPPLANIAYTEENMEELLEKMTQRFINSTSNILTPNKVQLSSIFDWYGTDFGNLVAFLNRYAPIKIRPNAEITFLSYDWALNGQ